MKKQIISLLLLLISANVFAQLRSFNDIFPNIDQNIKEAIFSEEGYVRTSEKTNGFDIIGNKQGSGIDPSIINIVLQGNPGFFVESISIISNSPGSVSLLDIYNALGNIRDLRGRLYNSSSRGRPVPLFEDATRIAGEKTNSSSIPDPPASRVLPQTETVFIRLRDNNFGNSFYRGEMALVQNGLRYTMSNFRNITYLFIPVIREGKFIAQMYFEPVQEGVLIYSVAGADVSSLFSSIIHVESSISKRLQVIKSWAADGIKRNRR